MSNRQLTPTELQKLFAPLFEQVRARMKELSHDQVDLYWALRRKLAKELSYEERGKPMQRRALKEFKRQQQGGKCASCGEPLPEKDVILDRKEAMGGYTRENTQLLCRPCDYRIQSERGFA